MSSTRVKYKKFIQAVS